MTLRQRVRRLSVRLVAVMTLAMLPLGLISLYQTRSVVERAEDLARSALIAETERAVAAERRVLSEAVGAAKGLGASIPSLAGDPQACSAVLREFIAQNNQFIFAGFLPLDGRMTCSSRDRIVDFSAFPGFADLIATPRVTFDVNEEGAVTGQSVMIASVPVWDGAEFEGYIAISIPHAIANMLLPEPGAEGGLKIAVLNREGRILSASRGLRSAEAFLPAGFDPMAFRDMEETTFRAETPSGETRIFAPFSLLAEEITVVGSWPLGALDARQGPVQSLLTVLFPILMWIAGISVAYFGLHRLVTRHIHKLRDAMRRFALGDGDVTVLELDNPPAELAEAERAFNRMVLLLSDALARREQDLHDKEVLLREVHHRVKNNLQMIASMMNMQSRMVTSSETKRVLSGLQRRVQGLASIHRSLYAKPDMTRVDVAELADELVREVTSLAGQGGQGISIKRNLKHLELYPDQAVPLSMVLSEMLTNAVKYVGTPAVGSPTIEVHLSEAAGGEITLMVENTKGAPLDDVIPPESTGIGTRLMQAFVMQLDGVEEVSEDADRYRMTVRFRRAEFDATAA